MNTIPKDLRYTKSHEWVRAAPDGAIEVGITDHAQGALGDLVFVEVPEEGRALRAGEACAVVESVKAASDIYSPVNGKVLAGNPALAAQPELLNQDPYGAGWLFRAQPNAAEANSSQANSSPPGEALMSAADYEKFLADEAH